MGVAFVYFWYGLHTYIHIYIHTYIYTFKVRNLVGTCILPRCPINDQAGVKLFAPDFFCLPGHLSKRVLQLFTVYHSVLFTTEIFMASEQSQGPPCSA